MKREIKINSGGAKTGGMIFLFVLIFAVFSYFYFSTRNLRMGPVIKIKKPSDALVVDSSVVELEGKVENVSRIFLNGRPIPIRDENKIKEKLLLAPGENSFIIEAYDKVGKKSVEKLKIIYKKAK